MSDTETRVLTMSPRTPPCCAGDTDVTTQDAEPTPEESLAALMGEQAVAEEPAASEPEPEETVTLRPMETMSAIDMVMGADEDRDD